MDITASMVKELRESTGAGMMECKKALVEANGDTQVAIEIMRKAGLSKADKKSSRIAADGVINLCLADDLKNAVIVEVNCETDFVAKGDDFQDFVTKVSQQILSACPVGMDELVALAITAGADTTIDQYRQTLVAKIGENIQVRRFAQLKSSDGIVGSYSHGGRIGVLVEVIGGDESLAKDVAMHIAASRPVCVAESDMPAEHLAKEREILTAQAKDSGKPDDIIEKMVEGRLKKYLAEVTLLGQTFVKDQETTVGKLLKSKNAQVVRFERYEVGEGIEKKEENFAEEVMAQVKGS